MAQVPVSLSIREVSQRSGCSASALRYYEQAGLIRALPRSETASRRYSPKVLDALDVITALRGAGFGISEIREFMAIKRPDEAVDIRLTRLKKAIASLQHTLDTRRAALERAEQLLSEWQQEIQDWEAAQVKPLPESGQPES